MLMGGNGPEREVSLNSGKEVVKNFDREKFEVFQFDLNNNLPDLIKFIQDNKIEVVFVALHGKGGEDGQIQGVLDLCNVVYTGSGVLACAIGMDKAMFKRVIEFEGIRVPKWFEVVENMSEFDLNKVKKLGTKWVVKPCDLGSSIGVRIVAKEGDLIKTISSVLELSRKAIVEEYVEGVEVSCGVIGNKNLRALPLIEIVPENDFFDYQAKYEGKSKEIVPARVEREVAEEVWEISKKIHKLVGARGFSRVDFIIRDNIPYVLEINIIPGLTSESLLPKESRAAGMTYAELLEEIVVVAINK